MPPVTLPLASRLTVMSIVAVPLPVDSAFVIAGDFVCRLQIRGEPDLRGAGGRG